jgi:hypothetical protein
MNYTLAIIIILLIIVIGLLGVLCRCEDTDLLLISTTAVVGTVLLGSCCNEIIPLIKGGKYNCDKSKPYGTRCSEAGENGILFDKNTCEAHCLTVEESKISAENLINMTFDKGIKFPIPRKFIEKHNTKLCNFDNVGMIVSLIAKRPVEAMKFVMNNHFTKFREEYKLSIDYNESIDKYYITPGTKSILESYISNVFNKKNDAIDIFDLTILQHKEWITTHANALIIDNRTKTIHYFEPHVGNNNVGDVLMVELEPLTQIGYKYNSTTSCPIGLQSVTGRGSCVTWSMFGIILTMYNLDKTYDELLRYLTGLNTDVKYILDFFLYYLEYEYKISAYLQKGYLKLTSKFLGALAQRIDSNDIKNISKKVMKKFENKLREAESESDMDNIFKVNISYMNYLTRLYDVSSKNKTYDFSNDIGMLNIILKTNNMNVFSQLIDDQL